MEEVAAGRALLKELSMTRGALLLRLGEPEEKSVVAGCGATLRFQLAFGVKGELESCVLPYWVTE